MKNISTFSIYQSNQVEQLLLQIIDAYKIQGQGINNVFNEFVVLVPSMVLGEWLKNSIASQVGISTLITSKFWGQQQWQLMQEVIEKYNQVDNKNAINVPEVAVLSTQVMQWRVFSFLTYYQLDILSNSEHPIHPLLLKIQQKQSVTSKPKEVHDVHIDEKKLWQLSEQIATVFNRYLTHRTDWLNIWSNNNRLNIQQVIEQKDQLISQFSGTPTQTPEWLIDSYVELEHAQSFLWQLLFCDVYQHRQKIEARFWQALQHFYQNEVISDYLPKCLYFFTIQQLPTDELLFLQKLSKYTDIKLFHYNPSKAYWADIVDKHWLRHQQLVNPSLVYFKEFGHTLLSRLGKQARETFASLSALSGNYVSDDYIVNWHDDFVSPVTNSIQDKNYNHNENESRTDISLLHQLQQDVLDMDDKLTKQMLDVQTLTDALDYSNSEPPSNLDTSIDRQWQLQSIDDSLKIHSCHNLQRQLEVLRGQLAKWLNEDTTQNRHISDILVLMPEVDKHSDLIQSIFVDGVGQDGLQLPSKITGVVDKNIKQLWHAIVGYYRLLGEPNSRFDSLEVFEWLMLPSIYESFGLNYDQANRACELLQQAGFIRGFNEAHLKSRLDNADKDYRFSFSYALDRLVTGLVMPHTNLTDCLYTNNALSTNQPAIIEHTAPFKGISLEDNVIISFLCQIYKALEQFASCLSEQKTAEQWLRHIEEKVIHPYFATFDQTRAMRAIYKSMNRLKRSLRANTLYQLAQQQTQQEQATIRTKEQNQSVNTSDNTGFSDDTGFNESINIQELPFRLNFILESIEKDIENQQISAEPTGMITFARFGALRTVPFKLVVMLNMNLSEFPRREKDDKYDLMKAGLARRGDKNSEDDDNGAFLDALLSARDACWIFYNGQSLTDNNEHLPAHPVSELIQFLQAEIDWQIDDFGVDIDAEELKKLRLNLGKHLENRIMVKHHPLPFSDEYFVKENNSHNNQNTDITKIVEPSLSHLLEQSLHTKQMLQQQSLPPAPIWQHIYRQLQQPQQQAVQAIRLLTEKQYQAVSFLCAMASTSTTEKDISLDIKLNINRLSDNKYASTTEFVEQLALPSAINIAQLASKVSNLGKTYLQTQQISFYDEDEAQNLLEPLKLNALDSYYLSDNIIQLLNETPELKLLDETVFTQQSFYQYDWSNLLFTPLLPAGINRLSSFINETNLVIQQQKQLQQQLFALNKNLQLDQIPDKITKITEQSVMLCCDILDHKKDIQVQGLLPKNRDDTVWINLLANRANAKSLLKYWLMHLLWQVARDTTKEQVHQKDGSSMWYFAKPNKTLDGLKEQHIIILAPISKADAIAELNKWITFMSISSMYPMVWLPEDALTYVNKQQQSLAKNETYTPKISEYRFVTSFKMNNQVFNTHFKHDIWQCILGSQVTDIQAYQQLVKALSVLSETLLLNMYQALQSPKTAENF